MRIIFAFIFTFYVVILSEAKVKINDKEKSEINSLLTKQVDAWNEGNLEKFMETYLKSDELVFVGSRGPTYGWQATLENY